MTVVKIYVSDTGKKNGIMFGTTAGSKTHVAATGIAAPGKISCQRYQPPYVVRPSMATVSPGQSDNWCFYRPQNRLSKNADGL